jgi:hypothetical protein
MRASRIGPTLIAACLGASPAGAPTAPPTSPAGPAAAAPTLSTLTGVVQLSATKVSPVQLVLDDGEQIDLDGPPAAELTSLENAVVDVRGLWSSTTFLVSDFLVRQVDGADVMDGVLIAIGIQDTDTGDVVYGLSLTRGPVVPLENPPAALTSHLGERVWVAASADGQPTAFGIIGR